MWGLRQARLDGAGRFAKVQGGAEPLMLASYVGSVETAAGSCRWPCVHAVGQGREMVPTSAFVAGEVLNDLYLSRHNL